MITTEKNKLKKRSGVPYLCVAHTGCSDKRLLDRVTLGEGRLLMGLRRLLRPNVPVTLDQVFHHLHVAPQGRVNQSTLIVLIQVVHLRAEAQILTLQRKLKLIRPSAVGHRPLLSCDRAR